LQGRDISSAAPGAKPPALASGHTPSPDANAAGWGWFVDPTPWENAEFIKPGNQGQQHRLDLLTVLPHDVGHLLGHDQAESSVREESLTAGTRRTPAAASRAGDAALLDQVFAGEPSLSEQGLLGERDLVEALLNPGKKSARGMAWTS